MSDSLEGVHVTIVGRVNGVSHARAKERLTARGATVGKSLVLKTTWLVAGYNSEMKVEQARTRGVPVLSEAQLQALVDGATRASIEALIVKERLANEPEEVVELQLDASSSMRSEDSRRDRLRRLATGRLGGAL